MAMDQQSAAVMAAELRAARAILGWGQQELSDLSDVSVPTILRFERADGRQRISTIKLLDVCLREHGVNFSMSDDGSLHIVVSARTISTLEQSAKRKEAISPRGKLGPRGRKNQEGGK